MNSCRQPKSVTEEFLQSIETASDERLAALLAEECDFTNYYEDINRPFSITDTIPERAGDQFGTWLADALEISISDRPLRLLTRLALLGHEKSFRIVHQALEGWSPSPSLNGSYIQLPTAEVFLVEWEHYGGAEEPTQWRNSVESGEAASGEVAAWPYNEEGYIESYAGSASFCEIVYDLSAATFESLRCSAKAIEAIVELEVAREHLHLHGEAHENGDSLTSAFGIDRCSSEVFGNRKKNPSVVTLVFNADLD